MKTRYLLSTIGGGMLLAICSLAFTSCDVEDEWYDGPSGWGNAFYDSRLEGIWQLVQADGIDVGRYDTNYLDFLGDGRGYYYYYRIGEPYSERMKYYCQESDSPSSRYQINLQYEYSSPVTMSYWFSDSTGRVLWLSWYDNNIDRTVTYLYRPVKGAPW